MRARPTLGGRLTALDPEALVFRPARAVLTDEDGSAVLRLDELSLASPDPLATHEAEMPARMGAAHADTVAPLARLRPAREQLGAVDVRPLRLDRPGLVLRSEAPDAHHDTGCPSPPRPATRARRCARSTSFSPAPPTPADQVVDSGQ
ncbi:hypothetical protein O3S80_44465 [Streptomyces sp. Lzd4kr]|nr:hypothetical protein [Streptomyces sp. Lzd4kr]